MFNLMLILFPFIGLLLIQGYKEEIFERLEISGFTSKSQIQDWLSGKGTKRESKRTGYSNLATQLQEPFALREAAEETDDFDELRELKRQAQSMAVADNKTENIIQERMDKVSKELIVLSEERKSERLEKEAKERIEKKIEKRKQDIEKDISRIDSLIDVNRIDKRIDRLDDEADVSDLRSQLEGFKVEFEIQKALEVEETRRRQEESRERKIKLEEEGILDLG